MNLIEHKQRLEAQIRRKKYFKYGFGFLVVIISMLRLYDKYEKEQIEIKQEKNVQDWFRYKHLPINKKAESKKEISIDTLRNNKLQVLEIKNELKNDTE